MTGYTVHTGPSGKFSEGWQKIFGASEKKPKAKAKAAKPAAKAVKPTAKKAATSKTKKSTR